MIAPMFRQLHARQAPKTGFIPQTFRTTRRVQTNRDDARPNDSRFQDMVLSTLYENSISRDKKIYHISAASVFTGIHEISCQKFLKDLQKFVRLFCMDPMTGTFNCFQFISWKQALHLRIVIGLNIT
jgi:hypothetical protein